jgi:hypothetical protein
MEYAKKKEAFRAEASFPMSQAFSRKPVRKQS